MSPSAELPPVLDDRYEFVDRIGTGGLGVVYRALDRRTRRMVAIKMIRDVDDHKQAILMRESRLLHRLGLLGDPGIVGYHDVILQDESIFLVQDLVEHAVELTKWQRGRRFEDILTLYLAMARTLTRVHNAGIVHRDLKPSNVLVKPADSAMQDGPVIPVLIDFGLAVSTREHDSLTGAGMLVGTPRYLSPEVLVGTTVGAAGDVFALGVMLFEAVAGRLPWPDSDVSSTLHGIVSADPRMDFLGPLEHSAIAPILAAMLAKDPSARPTAAQVAENLSACLSALAGDRTQTGQTLPLDGREVPRPPTAMVSSPSAADARRKIVAVEQGYHNIGAPAPQARMAMRGSPPRMVIVAGVLTLTVALAGGVLLTRAVRSPAQSGTVTFPSIVPTPNPTGGLGESRPGTNRAWARPAINTIWLLVLGAGLMLVYETLRGRSRRVAEARGALPQAVIDRIAAVEAKVERAGRMSETLALAVNDLGAQIDPVRLEQVIRQTIVLAMQQLQPVLAGAPGIVGMTLDPKPTPWSQKVTTYVGVGGGLIAACAALVALLGSLNVWHANHPPEIVAFAADLKRLNANMPRIVNVEARDPDGDALEFRYRASEGQISETGSSATWTPPPVLRQHVVQFQVWVKDGRLTTTTEKSVPVNQPPTGTVAIPQEVTRGAVTTLSARFTDADGDALTYQWETSAGTLTPNRSAVVFWRAPVSPGDAMVVCEVSDGFEKVTVTARVRVK